LKAHFSELEAEIKRIEQITSPLRAERDKLQAEIQPTENRMRELAKQYNQIERDAGLYELKNDLAETARSLGGKSLRNAPEQAEFVAGSEQEQQPQGETVETVNYGGTDHEWSEEGSTAGDSGKDQPQS
jgi:predicted nuclease with TOPRIM domain